MTAPLTPSIPAFAGGRERFLNACRCLPADKTPVWLMRQAGRSLPEYRALKEKHSFLELARTPELAAEATLQPIRRFGFDAAVLFSDILVVPEAMGQPYSFRETGGITMKFTVSSAAAIAHLQAEGAVERLDYVAGALRMLKAELAGKTALLGFAGSPWTLARYMVEGTGSGGSHSIKELFYAEPKLFGALLEKITGVVAEFLKMQIEAGADAVQIFDSNGDLLSEGDFEAGSGRWIREVISSLGGRVPVILFSKGGYGRLGKLVSTGANVLSVDWTQSLAAVRRALPTNVGVQGNLDPFLLTTSPETVAAEVARILREMKEVKAEGLEGHVFNLGHGVPKEAKLECLAALVETVRSKG